MKLRIFKPIAMLLLALITSAFANSVFAQQTTRSTDATPTDTKEKQQTDEEFKKGYSDKMAKFDQQYAKLKQKEASTDDPAMKSDLQNILSKMDATKSDMSRYESNSGNMSPEQKKQAQANIKTQMGDIKQMNEAAHTKYGNAKGEKGGEKQGADKSSKQGTTTGDTQAKDAPSKEANKKDAQSKETQKHNAEKEKSEKKNTTDENNPK